VWAHGSNKQGLPKKEYAPPLKKTFPRQFRRSKQETTITRVARKVGAQSKKRVHLLGTDRLGNSIKTKKKEEGRGGRVLPT